MNTTTATTKPAAKTFTCRICNGSGRYQQFGHGRSWFDRCGSCKGAKVVSAAKLLKQLRAEPRAGMERKEFVGLVAWFLGLDENGNDLVEIPPVVVPEGGFAGVLVDCEERGWSDIVDRAAVRASRLYAKPETYRPYLDAVMALIREARAAL